MTFSSAEIRQQVMELIDEDDSLRRIWVRWMSLNPWSARC